MRKSPETRKKPLILISGVRGYRSNSKSNFPILELLEQLGQKKPTRKITRNLKFVIPALAFLFFSIFPIGTANAFFDCLQPPRALTTSFHSEIQENTLDKIIWTLEYEAEKGIADSQYKLGIIYLHGNQELEDFPLLERWNYRAWTFLTRNVILRDQEKGMRYIEMAADQGHPDALKKLGVIYGTGQGVKVDPWRSVDYFVDVFRQTEALPEEILAYWKESFSYGGGPTHTERPVSYDNFFSLIHDTRRPTAWLQLPEKTPERVAEHVKFHFAYSTQGHKNSRSSLGHLSFLYVMGADYPSLDPITLAAYCRAFGKNPPHMSHKNACNDHEENMSLEQRNQVLNLAAKLLRNSKSFQEIL